MIASPPRNIAQSISKCTLAMKSAPMSKVNAINVSGHVKRTL